MAFKTISDALWSGKKMEPRKKGHGSKWFSVLGWEFCNSGLQFTGRVEKEVLQHIGSEIAEESVSVHPFIHSSHTLRKSLSWRARAAHLVTWCSAIQHTQRAPTGLSSTILLIAKLIPLPQNEKRIAAFDGMEHMPSGDVGGLPNQGHQG